MALCTAEAGVHASGLDRRLQARVPQPRCMTQPGQRDQGSENGGGRSLETQTRKPGEHSAKAVSLCVGRCGVAPHGWSTHRQAHAGARCAARTTIPLEVLRAPGKQHACRHAFAGVGRVLRSVAPMLADHRQGACNSLGAAQTPGHHSKYSLSGTQPVSRDNKALKGKD